MKKDMHIIVGICIVFLCTAFFLFYRGQDRTFLVEDTLSGGQSLPETEESPSVSETEECAVSVSGAVKHPGLYRYRGTARVCDAIEASGGFKKNAAKDSVNLARILIDGEQIQILTKKQFKKQKTDAKRADPASVSDKNLLNINTATKEELMNLPGIGEAKALLIINYREEHGNFSRPEDLMNISGIKSGIFNKIKTLITTE